MRLGNCDANHQKSSNRFVQSFTYANNTQIHRSTNSSLDSPAISRHLLGQSLHSATAIAPKASIIEISPGALSNLPQQRMVLIRTKTSSHRQKFGPRYKADYINRERDTPTYGPGSFVFADNTPLHYNQETAKSYKNSSTARDTFIRESRGV